MVRYPITPRLKRKLGRTEAGNAVVENRPRGLLGCYVVRVGAYRLQEIIDRLGEHLPSHYKELAVVLIS